MSEVKRLTNLGSIHIRRRTEAHLQGDTVAVTLGVPAQYRALGVEIAPDGDRDVFHTGLQSGGAPHHLRV